MIYIDGLQCSNYDRATLQELRTGRIDCVTVTCGFWSDPPESMDALVRWRELARENSDLVVLAHSAEDIDAAVESGRTAILLGYQNTSFLGGRIGYVELFADLGVRVGQLTYNLQNDVGSSCYEPEDSGLTRFGREVVGEMNRVGMLVDLSHVGNRTSIDAIEASQAPVAVSHANPTSLVPHKRNVSDDLLKALAANDGVVGLTGYRNLSGPYAESADTWAELAARTVDLIGIDHVGIGTDFGRNVGMADLQWMRSGRWSRQPQYGAGSPTNPGKQPPLSWLPDPGHFPAFEEALTRRGFAAPEVEAVMGGNWMRLYRRVFSSAPAGGGVA